jgi:hypothetical protein
MAGEQLNFWSEERPANPSQSQDSEGAWMTRVVTWPSDSFSLLQSCAPNGSYGKTCRASLVVEKDGILAPSSGRWSNSGTGGPTGRLTLNGLESPKDAVVCSLSHTLETGAVQQRYFLSAKACSGILRRAERRGRKLPERLAQALEGQVRRSSNTPSSAAMDSRSTPSAKTAK